VSEYLLKEYRPGRARMNFAASWRGFGPDRVPKQCRSRAHAYLHVCLVLQRHLHPGL
jgi:hypothetical protein